MTHHPKHLPGPTTELGPHDAVAARTAVLGEHGGQLIVAGATALSVAYVDDCGEPLIVLPAIAADMFGRGKHTTSLRVEGRDTMVLLHGRLSDAPLDGQAARALQQHRDCLTDHGVRVDDDEVRPVRLTVAGVLTTSASSRTPWWGVDLVAYVDAQPDAWCLDSDKLLAHLTDTHADDLLLLARRVQPAIGVDSRRWLLRATGLDPQGLDLRIVGPRGGYEVRIHFGQTVDAIDHVELALMEMLQAR